MLELESIPDLSASVSKRIANPPQYRLTKAEDAHKAFCEVYKADEQASKDRSQVDQMFDGDPPYDEAQLEAAGQAFRCNLNFDEAGELLDTSMVSHIDLLNGVEALVSVETDYGPPEMRAEWNEQIAIEFTRMVRNWGPFTQFYLMNRQNLTKHGVSICYFENEWDWRWRVAGMDDFKIPRDTLCAEEELDIAFCIRDYQVHHLYRFIEDEAKARDLGWNVEETRKAIREASADSFAPYGDWEKWQADMKDNDIGISCRSKVIKVAHGWVKERDGRVTHFMIRRDGECKQFLFRRPGRFPSMEAALTLYTYGVGSNNRFHSIRGLGYRIFPHIQVSNQLRCQMIDGAQLAASQIIQPVDEGDVDRLSLSFHGPYAVLAPGFKVIQTPSPNLSNNVIPVVNDLSNMVSRKTGAFSPLSGVSDTQDMSAREYVGRKQDRQELGAAVLHLCYLADQRHYRQVFARAARRNYPEPMPGATAVQKMRKRLLQKGVPLEALYRVDPESIQIVMAIGGGSRSSRTVALRELTDMAPGYDEVGRKRLIRDRTASIMGSYTLANRYAPPPEDTRITSDAKVAEFENFMLEMGREVVAAPNDMHLTHAQVHMGAISQHIQSAEQGAAPIEEVAPKLVPLHEHTLKHVEALSADPASQQDAAYLRKALQNAGEIIINGMRRLEAMRRQQAEEGGDPQAGEAETAHQAALRRKMEEHQVKLELMASEAELKRSIKIQEAETARAILDAKAAADISNLV